MVDNMMKHTEDKINAKKNVTILKKEKLFDLEKEYRERRLGLKRKLTEAEKILELKSKKVKTKKQTTLKAAI